jgi:hypothetical protein
MRSHDRRRLRSSARAAAARRFVGIAAMSVTLSGVRAAVVLYVAGLAVLVIGLSSILFAGWLAALLVIAGIAIFCAGIAAEERGYRE